MREIKINKVNLERPVNHQTALYNSSSNKYKWSHFQTQRCEQNTKCEKYSIFRFHFLPVNFNKQLMRNYNDAYKINGLRVEEISKDSYRDRSSKNEVKRRPYNEGDNTAKCPVKNQTCRNCNQKGHLTEKCSLAERLKAIERTKFFYSHVAIPEEEDEKCQNESNILTVIPKTPDFQENESINDQFLLPSESSPKRIDTPVLPNELQKCLQ
ncbi:hypothetical protein BpHYR1_037535 [Brachionus plicatilis]|uniref:CCHC-type domain-containing protein n=1 Tax=Brachionus plicatilis TaxID=10195 RepID=A0A3M7RZX1_BRAPC|nr:hypothetical protein BpHYR1_037535 [Brachionus plicatilis]